MYENIVRDAERKIKKRRSDLNIKFMNKIQNKEELIDQYLLGDMDESESAGFEKRLAEDPELGEETELTRSILSALRKEKEQAAMEAMESVPEETVKKWITTSQPAKQGSRRVLYLSISAAAAVILLLLFIGFKPRYTTGELFAQYHQVQPYETYPARGGSGLTPEEKEWLRQAEAYYRQGDYSNALSFYNRLLVQKPDWETLPDEAIWNLAFIYLKTGQREKAKACFETLMKGESDYAGKAGELWDKLNKKKWF